MKQKTCLRWMTGVVLSIMMIAMTLLGGCGSKKSASADQVAGALYKLVVLRDTKEVKELTGFSEEEVQVILDAQDSAFVEELRQVFQVIEYDVTEEELTSIKDAWVGAMKKLNFTAEVSQSSGDTTTVVLKTDWIDTDAISTQAVDQALEAIGGELTEDSITEYVQQYIKKLCELYNQAVPNTDQKTIEAEFQKQKVSNTSKQEIWYPKDATTFTQNMMEAVLGTP